MKKKQHTKSIVELIFAALFYQLGRDFCVQHNVAPSNPLYSAMRKKDCVFVFDALIAILSIRQQHSASAPIEQWLEHHDPAELLDVCKECLLCRMPDEAAQYEDAFQVLSKVINDAPEIAADILNYLRDHPYTSVLPYQVLGIQHAPWRKTKIVRRVGIGFSAHEWTDSAHDEKSSLFIVNLCANYSYHYYHAPEGYCPSFINRPLTEDELKWITLKPHGAKKKGQPILIEEEEGKPDIIKGGLGGKFNNQPMTVLGQSKHKVKRKDQSKRARSQQEVEGASYLSKRSNHGLGGSVAPTKRSNAAAPALQQDPITYKEAHAQKLENQANLDQLIRISDQKSIALARSGALSLSPIPNKQQEPLSYAFLVLEHRENLALGNSPDWRMPFTFDVTHLYSDDASFREGATNAELVAKGAYAYRSLKRMALKLNRPLTEQQMELGESFEVQYQATIEQVSHAHALRLAARLAQCAQQIGPQALVRAKQAAMDVARLTLTNKYKEQDVPPSLLSLIGTASNARNPFYSQYNDVARYILLSSSITDFKNSCGSADNLAFNNLFNALYLTTAVKFNSNASPELKAKVNTLYNQAYCLYRESHGQLPISVALNRDMAVIIQQQSMSNNKSRYGEHFYFPKYANGIPQRSEQSIALYLWLEINSSHYAYHVPNSDFCPFAHNCQAGVVALELFQRGYDVVARPNMKNDHNLLPDLSLHPNLIWYNPIIKTAPDIRPITDFKQLEKLCYFSERYNLILKTVGVGLQNISKRNSHIVTVIRIEPGVRIVDPQLGFCGSIQDFEQMLLTQYGVKVNKLFMYRIDDCEVFGTYLNQVIRPLDYSDKPVLDAKRG
ncbi:MAG TPA: hypothetical protein H9898_11095 [Candidatus Anaerobiospirillum stercoravium]|nr:hypothetical protein [Candidatus Anaerobiospirillum stercoravium]